MSSRTTMLFAAMTLGMFAHLTFAQAVKDSRAQARSAETPRVIKFQGKGLPLKRKPLVARYQPSAPPPPLDPAILLSVYKSLGLSGQPQPGEYALLTAQQPFVAGRGEMLGDGMIRFDAEQNYVRCSIDALTVENSSAGCGMSFDIKPAAVGQSYLIDIVMHIQTTTTFNVDGPDGSESVETLPAGTGHILATFVAANTKWQGVSFYNAGAADWSFLSCKVTLLK